MYSFFGDFVYWGEAPKRVQNVYRCRRPVVRLIVLMTLTNHGRYVDGEKGRTRKKRAENGRKIHVYGVWTRVLLLLLLLRILD